MRALRLTALLLGVLAGAWWLARSQDPDVPAATVGDPAAADRRSVEAPAPLPEPATAPQPDEQAFRERLRTFLAGAAGLVESDRNAQAEALRQDTLAREADGALLPAESAYIQLALLRATIADEDQRRRRSETLLQRYETASEQGWEEYRRRSDPRHEAYREAEAELIRRAREDDVAGDELRERLQALREQHYE